MSHKSTYYLRKLFLWLLLYVHNVSYANPRNLFNIRKIFDQSLKRSNNINNNLQLPIHIQESPERGFELVSDHKFFSGEIILLDVPVVSWCYDPKRTRCSHCFTKLPTASVKSSNTYYCHRCNEKYCSAKCRQNAELYHAPLCCLSLCDNMPNESIAEHIIHRKVENFAMRKFSASREDGYISLIMRLYALSASNPIHKLNPLSIPEISILSTGPGLSSLDSTPNHRKQSMENFFSSVHGIYSESLGSLYNSNPPSESLNRIRILQYQLQHYAILTYEGLNGLYLSASFMNHDCSPNAEIVLDPDRFKPGHIMKIRCIRDIDVGDKITISYVDPNASYKKRQSDLKKEYHFECRCNRCVTESSLVKVPKKGELTIPTIKPSRGLVPLSTSGSVKQVIAVGMVRTPDFVNNTLVYHSKSDTSLNLGSLTINNTKSTQMICDADFTSSSKYSLILGPQPSSPESTKLSTWQSSTNFSALRRSARRKYKAHDKRRN